MSVSTLVAILIFAIIAIRQWLPSWLRIWHVMLAGAVVIVVTGQVSPTGAFGYIDRNIIAYLFGVFSIGIALYHGGGRAWCCDLYQRCGRGDRHRGGADVGPGIPRAPDHLPDRR